YSLIHSNLNSYSFIFRTCYGDHQDLYSFPTRRSSDLIDYAKSQMKQTRELFSKNDGIQAHHVIQSFKPDEVTPEKANQVGLELAKKLAPNHEVAVYTHDD